MISHLVRRFFASVTARRLSAAERRDVHALLSPAERALFDAQPARDQRHGYRGVVAIAGDIALPALTGETALVARAAALHDIGKAAARLRLAGRVWAGLRLLGVPVPHGRRVGLYLAHGELGARLLADAGSPDLVVAWARAHHAPGADVGPHTADLAAADLL